MLSLAVLGLGLAACTIAEAQDPGLPVPGAAKGSVVHGVDVADQDGAINWARAANAKIAFAFIRVSDGFRHDTSFATNWSGAKSAGIIRGAYQYFRASDDGAKQANDFLDQIKETDANDLPTVADVETLDGESPAKLAAQLTKWVKTVESRTGRTPLIYTSPGLWSGWRMPAALAACPLWVAHWGVKSPALPTGWSEWKFWQYSDTATVAGISKGHTDADEFQGTLDDLKAFVRSTASTKESAAPATPGAANAATVGVVGALDGKLGAGSADTLLKTGATGDAVTRLQKLLDGAGSNVDQDGVFGPETEQAVIAFQKAHGCDPDGAVGAKTWAALESAQR
jgi:lysozyme